MKTEDLAYAAGLIDGEGCVLIQRHHGFNAIVQVAMSVEAPVRWLESMFGGYVVYKNSPALRDRNRKPQWSWRLSTKTAREFLRMVRPWLKVKDQHADLILGLRFYEQGGSRPTQADRAAREEAVYRLAALNAKGRS